MSGAYCEQYGNSIYNQVIEHFLENDGDYVSAGQMAEELKISRQKAYDEIRKLEAKGLVKKQKKFRGTQLYQFDKKNPRVKLLEKNFMQVLELVAKEYAPKKSSIEEQNELLRELIKGVNELKRKIKSG